MNCRDYVCTMVQLYGHACEVGVGISGMTTCILQGLSRFRFSRFLVSSRLSSSHLPRISPHLLFFAERRSKTNAEKSSCEHALARNGCMRSCSAEARLSGTRSKERFKKWWYSLLHFAWFFSLGGPCGRDERDSAVQCV